MLINEIFEQILEKKEKNYVWSIYLDKYNTLDRSEDIDIFKMILYIMDLKYDYNSKKLLDLEQQETLDKIYNISLTRDNIDKLISFDYTCLPVEITAKLNLFLWGYRKNSLAFAEKAIKEYYILYEKNFNIDEWVDCFDYFKVVVKLCKLIGENNETAAEYLDKCFSSLLSIDGEDSSFLSHRMIELFLSIKYSKVNELENLIEKIIRRSITINDFIRVEFAYSLKIEFLKQMKKSEEIKDCNLDLAQYYENMLRLDNDNCIFYNLDILCKLFKIYKQDGKRSKESFERTKKLILNEQSKVPSLMIEYQNKIDVTEYNKYILSVVQNLNLISCINFLIYRTRIFDIKKLNDDFQKSFHEYPASHLFDSKFFASDGRCVAELPAINLDHEKLKNNYLYDRLRMEEDLCGILELKNILNYIRLNFETSKIDFSFIVDDNVLISDDRKDIINFALNLGFTGNLYAALQILVLQFEECFRNLVKIKGGTPYTFSDNGVSEAKHLSPLLDMEEVKSAIGEDIVFALKGLLCEETGSNFRNKIAHGLFERMEAESGCGLYLFCLILKILVGFSNNALMKYIENIGELKEYVSRFNRKEVERVSYIVEFLKDSMKVRYKFLDFDDLKGEADSIQEARKKAQTKLLEKINEYKNDNVEIPAPTILEVVPNKREIISVVVKK